MKYIISILGIAVIIQAGHMWIRWGYVPGVTPPKVSALTFALAGLGLVLVGLAL